VAVVAQNKKVLTQVEKEKLIKEHLGNDFDLRGSDFAILSNVIDFVSYTDSAVGIAEVSLETAAIWLPKVGAVLKSGLFVTAAEGLAIGSIILFPVGALIAVVNAYDSANRAHGMLAVSYTIVAWSFGDLIPLTSSRIEQNVRANWSNGQFANKTLNGLKKAWFDSSNATLRMLNNTEKSGNKEALQLVFRALGEGDRQKLKQAILKGFEKNMSFQEKIHFKTQLSLRYPE